MFRKQQPQRQSGRKRERDESGNGKWWRPGSVRQRERQRELVRECEQKNRTKIQTTQQAHKIE